MRPTAPYAREALVISLLYWGPVRPVRPVRCFYGPVGRIVEKILVPPCHSDMYGCVERHGRLWHIGDGKRRMPVDWSIYVEVRCTDMNRSVCNARASNGGRSLCVQIWRERSYPLPSCSVQLSYYRRQLQTCIGNSWEKTLFTYFLLHVCRKLQHETCQYSVDIYVNFVQK